MHFFNLKIIWVFSQFLLIPLILYFNQLIRGFMHVLESNLKISGWILSLHN